MKFFSISMFLACSLLSASVNHQVVFVGGESAVGRVVDIRGDSLYFQRQDQKSETVFSLKDILYAHNGEGKLFYISDRVRKFIRKSMDHGGTIVTIDGQKIPYSTLGDELFMYDPRLTYYTLDSNKKKYIELGSVHKVTVDHTVSKYAVWKGFYAGSALAAFSFLIKFKSLKQFYDLNTISTNASEVYPGLVTMTPIITIGWIVYDFFRGKREFLFNKG